MPAENILVDSHCHLDFDDFADDLDEDVVRAAEAGVGTMVTICTRLTALDRVLSIAERYPSVWCALGIHPHNVAETGRAHVLTPHTNEPTECRLLIEQTN